MSLLFRYRAKTNLYWHSFILINSLSYFKQNIIWINYSFQTTWVNINQYLTVPRRIHNVILKFPSMYFIDEAIKRSWYDKKKDFKKKKLFNVYLCCFVVPRTYITLKQKCLCSHSQKTPPPTLPPLKCAYNTSKQWGRFYVKDRNIKKIFLSTKKKSISNLLYQHIL